MSIFAMSANHQADVVSQERVPDARLDGPLPDQLSQLTDVS
jgi:hypothetical protein